MQIKCTMEIDEETTRFIYENISMWIGNYSLYETEAVGTMMIQNLAFGL